jgi:2-hydroxycyclohexanecarboxyl-CoA dehydrogenase
VTGGGGSIGSAIGVALAADGHSVAIADLDLETARQSAGRITASGGRAAPIELDVTDGGAMAEAISTVERELGSIEILVNNAGWDELKPFVETDEAFWDRVIEINFKGCLQTTREVLPGMMERGYGRIVNIASDAARVGSSMESVYAGAKGAVIAFTKTIARETARAGITANAVCPGPTRTPMLDGMAAEGGQKLVDALVRAVPMRRLAEPEDIAAAVAFLASDRAGYITGQTLSVSGGLTMA